MQAYVPNWAVFPCQHATHRAARSRWRGDRGRKCFGPIRHGTMIFIRKMDRIKRQLVILHFLSKENLNFDNSAQCAIKHGNSGKKAGIPTLKCHSNLHDSQQSEKNGWMFHNSLIPVAAPRSCELPNPDSTILRNSTLAMFCRGRPSGTDRLASALWLGRE